MKKLIASLILTSLVSSPPVPAQIEKDEIRLLIASAPLVEAMSKAEEMDTLVIWNWLKALSYTGHANEAFVAATKIREWINEDLTNCAIAVGLADAGDTDEAVSLLRRTKHPSGYRILIVEMLTKAGRFSEALNEARGAEGASERDQNLQPIVKELVARGEIEQALDIADEIRNEESLISALRHVLKRLLKAGKFSEAKVIAQRIPSTDIAHSPPTYIDSPLRRAIFDLALDMVDDGPQDNALAMVEFLENEADRSFPLAFIAESFARAGRLDEALETTRKITDEFLLETTLAKIAAITRVEDKTAHKQGDGNEAIDQPTVEGLLKADKIDDALIIAQNIKDEGKLYKAFRNIVEHLLRSGSYENARLTADRCPSPVLRMFLYFDMFNELSSQSKPQLRTQLEKYRVLKAL